MSTKVVGVYGYFEYLSTDPRTQSQPMWSNAVSIAFKYTLKK